MIELDIVSHDMFDLPPLSEYELYVKKFGADDTRQVNQGYAVCKTYVPYMSVHTCSTIHIIVHGCVFKSYVVYAIPNTPI